MKVGVIGAGGIGGFYGGVLARGGNEVAMFARGANLDAIRANGIKVQTPEDEFVAAVRASDNAEELSADFGEGDFAMVATKSYSLSEVAKAVKAFADRGASILPLQNGVEAAEILISLGVPRDRVLGGVTYISAVHVGPGSAERRNANQRVIVGELNGGISQRTTDIANAFASVEVQGEATDDITLAIWQKFVFLASIAAGCGLTRLNVGAVRDSKLGRQLLERGVNEAVEVGRARGVALRSDEEMHVMSRIDGLPPDVEPSLLLDLKAGSRTEVEVLSGAIARFGDALGIDTPIHDTAAVSLAHCSG
ncbi:MAG: 2-dehydropantoate 2-reductase [Gemmatimonadaceae bacterium]